MLKFYKATYLSLLFNFTLSERLSNSLRGSDVFLSSEFINIVSILFYDFIEFIVMAYTFLVISFARNKECIICLISFCKFSDALPAFTSARATGNLRSISFGVNILICLLSETLFTRATRDPQAKSEESPLTFYCLLKSITFSTISTISFGFSFSGISFLLEGFLNSINPLLT